MLAINAWCVTRYRWECQQVDIRIERIGGNLFRAKIQVDAKGTSRIIPFCLKFYA